MRFFYFLAIIALFAGISTPARADYAVRMGQAIVIYPGDAPVLYAPQPVRTIRHGSAPHHSAGYYLHASHRHMNGCAACGRPNRHRWTYTQVNYPHR